MNFKEFTAEIALRSKVDEQVARRVIKQIYSITDETLDAGKPMVLPSFGRIVVHKNDAGTSRYVLHRANKTTDA